MKEININVTETGCQRSPLLIGYQGENEVTRVIVDYSAWTKEFGEGTLSLEIMRAGDTVPYLTTLTEEDGKAVWTVSNVDTGAHGEGAAGFVFTIGEQVKKSAVFRFFVGRDVGGTPGDRPDPYESLITYMEKLLAQMEENAAAAETAQGAAETAQTAAEAARDAAASSATDAAGSATTATEQAQAAATARAAAETAQTAAEAARDAAASSATDAAGSATTATQQAQAAATARAAAETAQGAAEAAQTAAETAQTAAVAAKTATETARDTAISTLQTEGAAQKAAIQQKGAEVLESIPEDYTDLSDEVDDLKSAITKTVKGNPADFVMKYLNNSANEQDSNYLALTKRVFNYMQDGLLTVEVKEPYVIAAYGWKRYQFLKYLGTSGWGTGDVKLFTKLNLSEFPDAGIRFGLRHIVNGNPVEVTPQEAVNLTFTFKQNSFLANRKISVMGDSISSFTGYTSPNAPSAYYPRSDARMLYVENMYWKTLADRNGMVIDTIDAYAGSTVGDKWQDTVRVPFIDDTRINSLGTPDVIIIEGGINDFGGNPLGDYPAIGDYSKTYEFRTAYSLLLNKLKTKYTQATIICLSMTSPRTYNNTTFPEKQTEVKQALATDTTPHTFAEFNESIEHIAKQYQCAYCDITDLLDYYLNPTSALGPHWFSNLHLEVAYRIEQLLKQIFA